MPGTSGSGAPDLLFPSGAPDAFELGRAASAMSAIPVPAQGEEEEEEGREILRTVLALEQGQKPPVKAPGLSDHGTTWTCSCWICVAFLVLDFLTHFRTY